MVRERKKNQGKEKKKHMLECWTVPWCTKKFRENWFPFSKRNLKKKKKTPDGKESSMVYQPIQRNLVFAAEFSGETRPGSMAFHRLLLTFQTKLGQDKQ